MSGLSSEILASEIRDFYTRPAVMTEAGGHAASFADLTRDLRQLCAVVQGLMLHFHWANAYGVALTPARGDQQHLRAASATLDAALAISAAPLTERREPADRAVGVCRHFAVVTSAMLRAQGIPARSRCGFGTYFVPGEFVDHWVVEYWDGSRWRLTDSQIDALQAGVLKPDFDLLDVPRDRFVIAGDAWRRYRAGQVDPTKFGIMDMHGAWFIAGNVLRDFAALNNMEMLPWDCWGPVPASDEAMTREIAALVDRLADLTLDADNRFAELRALYEVDPGLHVPAQVFNAIRNQLEPVA